ncbi:MAG: hypothetical protein J5602_05285 [Clostridia bacterium]|nr:hypothetical protein [Clostridia bacterium]
MKKITALALAALLLLTAAPALAADQYGAWTIELKDILLTADGEEIAIGPSVVVQAGFTDSHEKGWLTADVMKDGRSLAGFMAEEKESGFSRYAYTAGKTCGVMDGKNGARFHRLVMERLGMDEIPETLSGALDMLDAFLSMPKGVEYLFSQLGSAKKLGGNRYAVRVDLPGGSVEATLSWRWERRVKKPFDFNGRSEKAYSASSGIDGTEGFAEARDELEATLMEDETMEEAMIALMILFGEG